MKILTMLTVSVAVLLLSPRHRERVRRFVSRRIVDRDARSAELQEEELEEERWDDDGGATGATTEETVG